MYHLAKSLYFYATSKEEYSALLLGLDNAGKTTLLNQVKALYLPPTASSIDDEARKSNVGRTVPTVGQNVATIPLQDMYLKVWDVGGQISMRGLWQSYYSSCHAIIFVVDSTDVGDDADVSRLGSSKHRASDVSPTADDLPEEEDAADEHLKPIDPASTFGRLDECRQVLESVLQHADAAGVPLLVLANKQDREDCVEVVRIKEGLVRKVFEGEEGGAVRDSRVLPVSALMGVGVREAVEWVRSRVKWNKEARPPLMR
ncbi:ADP-ribosylation factor protein 3 [Emydomyces testavorans]|uniref:ADP-ribosylation factor protein 3 n=1 Tax=Emydomyces testavorans TaxID=2070801 RepID=A0AAF0DAD0_9EURO|nr:ADP-ribosylation factor protein 3 [Emydomyces testavorans]